MDHCPDSLLKKSVTYIKALKYCRSTNCSVFVTVQLDSNTASTLSNVFLSNAGKGEQVFDPPCRAEEVRYST
jgi:hypothetical protein